MADCINCGMRKTRKPHKCHGCGCEIPKGTYANYWTVADGGNIYTGYTCDVCNAWCGEMKCKDCFDDESAFEGHVRECMKENEKWDYENNRPKGVK